MEQPSTGKVILKTALITTAAMIVACVMIAVVVFFCFPYTGYKFMRGLGMEKSALFFAERYERGDNIDGLVYCLELDDELLSSTGDTAYADKMITHTEKFFEYEKPFDYFAQLDEYYLKNSDPQAQVGLYSYYEYVVSQNFKARAITGKADKMIFRDKVTDINKLLGEDNELLETAIIFSAVSKSLKYDKSIFVGGTGYTEFYNSVKGEIPSYIHDVEVSGADELTELFYLRSVTYLINEVKAQIKDYESDWDEFGINYKGYDNLNKAYTKLLSDYIKNSKGEKA